MTILYTPVLIESAEQAEKLPEGTIAHTNSGGSFARKTPDGWRPCYSATPEWGVQTLLRGWTALVPIEAVEEHVAPDAITYTRYVTAWEEA